MSAVSAASPNRQVQAIARGSFVLAGLAPWLLPFARAWLSLGAIGSLADAPFALICHRLPERTLSLAGVAMPVCSRCAGIFAGLALGAATGWPALPMPRARIALAAALLLLIADVVTQALGVHPLWHASRLATGALLGHLAAATIVGVIANNGTRGKKS